MIWLMSPLVKWHGGADVDSMFCCLDTMEQDVYKRQEMEQAFRLSDFYIQKLDGIHTVEEVQSLHDEMVMDYTCLLYTSRCV